MLQQMGAASGAQDVFRIAYASRAVGMMRSDDVVALADDAARNNRRNAVSGVLFSGDGVFVQWLEGPQDAVRPLMSRIEADPRHKDVTILSAGWASNRRYRRWPMQLADCAIRPSGDGRRNAAAPPSPCDASGAMAAFDAMAETHHRHDVAIADERALPAAFAQRLIHAAADAPAQLPPWTRADLHARAQFVDDVCAAFMAGWREDLWSASEIAVGMAQLFCLWQQAGRAPDPLHARRAVAVVVPPGAGEMLGAIVKADLLRAAGVWVDMICAPDADSTIAALTKAKPHAAIVAGSRVGWRTEEMRSGAFGDFLRASLPQTPVFVGGRGAGSLRECARRLVTSLDRGASRPSHGLEWLALTALSSIQRKRGASAHSSTGAGRA